MSASEAQMMQRVAEMFSKMGHHVATEVRYFERRIDLVAVERNSGCITCVEGKLSAWRKGVSQVLLAQPASHRTYLAIDRRFAGRVSLDILRHFGIGLIVVGARAKIGLDAPRVGCTNEHCVEMVRQEAMAL